MPLALLGSTLLVLGSVLAAFGAPADAAGPLDAAIDSRVTTQKEAADSQERIDAVADRTHAILLDFQHVGTSCRSSWGRAMVNSLRRESRP